VVLTNPLSPSISLPRACVIDGASVQQCAAAACVELSRWLGEDVAVDASVDDLGWQAASMTFGSRSKQKQDREYLRPAQSLVSALNTRRRYWHRLGAAETLFNLTTTTTAMAGKAEC